MQTYQILLTILSKVFIKLNVNTKIITKNKKLTEFNIKIVSAFLRKKQTLKII